MARSLKIVVGVHDTFFGLREALSSADAAILPVALGSATLRSELGLDVPLRTAIVVETSGTSQQPKRVALSADAVLASAAASASALGGEGQWLLAVPPHYIAGINVLVRSIVAGWEPVVLDSLVAATGTGFSPSEFVTAATQLEAPLRFTSLVPAQLSRLMTDPAAIAALRRFNAVLVGGQSLPTPLAD